MVYEEKGGAGGDIIRKYTFECGEGRRVQLVYIYKGVEVFGFVTLKLLNYKFHFNMRHTNLKLSIKRFARNNKKLKYIVYLLIIC